MDSLVGCSGRQPESSPHCLGSIFQINKTKSVALLEPLAEPD